MESMPKDEPACSGFLLRSVLGLNLLRGLPGDAQELVPAGQSFDPLRGDGLPAQQSAAATQAVVSASLPRPAAFSNVSS